MQHVSIQQQNHPPQTMPRRNLFPEFAHQSKPNSCDCNGCKQRQVSEEVGDKGTQIAVQAEVIDEVEAQSTADVVELVGKIKYD